MNYTFLLYQILERFTLSREAKEKHLYAHPKPCRSCPSCDAEEREKGAQTGHGRLRATDSTREILQSRSTRSRQEILDAKPCCCYCCCYELQDRAAKSHEGTSSGLHWKADPSQSDPLDRDPARVSPRDEPELVRRRGDYLPSLRCEWLAFCDLPPRLPSLPPSANAPHLYC